MRNTSVACEETIELLHKSVRAFAATTRRGAAVEPSDPYSGFSLCHYTGDVPEHWQRCRDSLTHYCGLPQQRIAVPEQVHDSKVHIISDYNFSEADLYGVDGVVTALPGLIIGVNTADCLPLILIDEEAGVAGAVHAGWRGAVAGIVENAVEAMIRLGATPAGIRAFMAPCIMADDFEVGEEVARQFPAECVIRSYGPRPHVDLPKAAAIKLRGCGISDISLPAASTMSNPDRYFSARAAGKASGRNFTFVYLRKL